MISNQQYKYPIGKFSKPKMITSETINNWISIIEDFPTNLSKEIFGLSEKELLYKYRQNGWNIKQIVHHCADSHMNSFIRFKLALTEENPTIKPYFEDKWAELPDSSISPINLSLKILEGLHSRWTILLKSLNDQQLNFTFYHPENKNEIKLSENIGIYAWHCNHHLEHIKLAKKFKTKFIMIT